MEPNPRSDDYESKVTTKRLSAVNQALKCMLCPTTVFTMLSGAGVVDCTPLIYCFGSKSTHCTFILSFTYFTNTHLCSPCRHSPFATRTSTDLKSHFLLAPSSHPSQNPVSSSFINHFELCILVLPFHSIRFTCPKCFTIF